MLDSDGDQKERGLRKGRGRAYGAQGVVIDASRVSDIRGSRGGGEYAVDLLNRSDGCWDGGSGSDGGGILGQDRSQSKQGKRGEVVHHGDGLIDDG